MVLHFIYSVMVTTFITCAVALGINSHDPASAGDTNGFRFNPSAQLDTSYIVDMRTVTQ